MTSGSCLCGAVHLTIDGPLAPATACHCTQCRKISGHYTAAIPVPQAGLSVTGTLTWYRSSPTARRGFCPSCGSYLIWQEDGRETVFVSAGCLDAPTGTHLNGHIFAADKGDYYEIADGLPQYRMWDKP